MLKYENIELVSDYILVNENETKYKINLKDRLLNFAVETIKFLSEISDKKEYNVIKYQLSKSATAIGANFEEAQSSGDKEFIHKLRIALREANETYY
jgi:four helix bundle protein